MSEVSTMLLELGPGPYVGTGKVYELPLVAVADTGAVNEVSNKLLVGEDSTADVENV